MSTRTCTYDFHVHTALSPCGHEEMTPNNIINMAKILELDAIAITDHNSCENVEAVMEVGQQNDILVIPGMEIESREEIHVVTFFDDIKNVYNMQKIVHDHLPPLKNKSKIFGEQLLFNKEDEVIGHYDRFLATATDLSIDEICQLCKDLGGVAIPAHVDRPSYSILSNLGLFPEELQITTIEVSKYVSYEAMVNKYPQYRVIQSSDAHDLESLIFPHQHIEIQDLTRADILSLLKTYITTKSED